jgi:hypothetical protein
MRPSSNLREAEPFSEWTISADADLLRRLDGRSAVDPSLREATKRDGKYYLAEAEFCAELAESMKRPDYKDRLLKIAQEWRDLATQAGGGGEVTRHRH